MQILSQQIRIHKSILLRHPAAKLWYLCRAVDIQSRGRALLTAEELALLKVSKSTIYRWLQQGKDLGFFRIYEFRPDSSLYVSLGGLKKACRQSGMKSWGPVTTVPLREVLEGFLRPIASGIQTQDLQEKSHYAATNSIPVPERRRCLVPTANQVLGNLTSPHMNCGVLPGLLKRGADKIFVGRSFIPFGVSQAGICAELNAEVTSCGICPRTLRNHLKRLGIERRQLVQTKPEYRTINQAIQHGAAPDGIRLFETNGKSSAKRPGGHILKPERLFQYFGTDWIYRCNLYDLGYDLTSMKRSRREYQRMLRQSSAAGAGTDGTIRASAKRPKKRFEALLLVENPALLSLVENPPTPPIQDMALALAPQASAHNKEEKNKNGENGSHRADRSVVSEPISSGRAKWLAMGEKLKASSQQRRQERLERQLKLGL